MTGQDRKRKLRLSKTCLSMWVPISLFLCVSTSSDEAEVSFEPLVIVTIENSIFTVLCGEILKEAYQHIGRDIEIKFVPGNRSIRMSASGKFDGDAARIRSVGSQFPDLLVVDVPYINLDTYLFVRPERVLDDEPDLSQIRLGILKGVVYNEVITRGLNPVYAKTVPQLFSLLLLDRVDAVILSSFSGDLEIARNFRDGKIIKKQPALYSIPMFHYLHRHNAHLLPEIEASLRGMLDSGRIDEIKQTLRERMLLGQVGLGS